MKEDRNYVTALARGLQVLRCFTAERPELGVTEIARLINLSQSTVWRLCYTLQKDGYLVPGAAADRLRAGPGVLTLGCGSISQAGITSAAQPTMEAIANRFQASVSIAARDGLQMVIAGRAAAHTFLRLNFQVGSSLRIERSAVGCAYLAGTTEENRKDLMAAIKLAYPKEWKENKGYIEESLSLYRSRGYVLNLRRYHPEVNALGVPIVSSSGRQVMALNCGGASSIMSREMLEGPVAQAMTQLASDLAPMLGI